MKKAASTRGEFGKVVVVLFFLAAAMYALLGVLRGKKLADTKQVSNKSSEASKTASFVGSGACLECHELEYEQWRKSDHFMAMQKATDDFVHADFNDKKLEHFGQTFHFFKKDGKFFCRVKDKTGKETEHELSYTFGHYPLQQFLVDFSEKQKGALQALNVVWDARPRKEGGQRWTHLYPDEEIPKGDLLHWTGKFFNWNHMCAECHSVNFQKNYDFAKNSFKSSWAEINVACESCHGPTSSHVEWARGLEENFDTKTLTASEMGLSVSIQHDGRWQIDPKSLKPTLVKKIANDWQMSLCSRCHAHRRKISTTYIHGEDLLDHYTPSILAENLYHDDGQIDEEVYVYGSFLQSKMHAAGVRCLDCHDAHTMKPIAQGDKLCFKCHLPQKYADTKHHKHEADSSGASCIACHMPHKYYMVVDKRHDHSFRIPRPDLSLKTGTPNACQDCHQDGEEDWLTEHFLSWYEDSDFLKETHFGEVFHNARKITSKTNVKRNEIASAREEVLALIEKNDAPQIVRATALSLLGGNLHIENKAQMSIAKSLSDKDALVRLHAVLACERMPLNQSFKLCAKNLNDKSRAVRIEAARILAPLFAENEKATNSSPPLPQVDIDNDLRTAFIKASEEYLESLRINNDRGNAHMSKGIFYQKLGKISEAEKSYKDAVTVDSKNVAARLNLAELYWLEENDADKGEALLRTAVATEPNSSHCNEALGRNLIRQKKYVEALAFLKKAAELAPDRADLQFFCGVALESQKQYLEAKQFLSRACELEAANNSYLQGTLSLMLKNKDKEGALNLLKEIKKLREDKDQIEQVIRSLE